MAPGLAQGPFDVIVYRPALDSVLDPMGVLRELSGALVTDGLLVVSVHVRDHPVHRLKGAADGLWTEPERRVCFDRQSLALSLLRSGLQPQRLDHAPHRPGMVTVFARRDPR
jgi:hypothetical protein